MASTNLDKPTDKFGHTQRQVNDWEARHASFCKRYHRQPCNCSPWDFKK